MPRGGCGCDYAGLMEVVRPSGVRLWLRWAELLVLFGVVPGLIAAAVDPAGRLHGAMRTVGLGWMVRWAERPGAVIFPALLGTTALILVWLLLDRSFEKKRLWDFGAARADLPRILTLWGFNAVGLLAVTWLMSTRPGWMPEGAFMRLPRENPGLLVFIWLMYPWVSALPQEVTHRVFFWHRYAGLFPGRWGLIVVNALAFAWMHALFWNWVALAMTFAGGLLFAYTYDRTRSGLAAAVEHGLYGNWCFTVGLGWFVFGGSIGR